ncbi:hypothetical protein ACFQ3B_04285 [Stackebrandtia endophytica]|nr:hypothetical protein [Stackebrandtia endophytica]
MNLPSTMHPRRRIANRTARRRLRSQELLPPVTTDGVADPEDR